MSSIAPTIGRKVWYWTNNPNGMLDNKQAFDATILFVHNPTMVNLSVIDHEGNPSVETSVQLRDPAPEGQKPDQHEFGGSAYATWMPYQTSQAKAGGQSPQRPADVQLRKLDDGEGAGTQPEAQQIQEQAQA